jgi:hypothetical protein
MQQSSRAFHCLRESQSPEESLGSVGPEVVEASGYQPLLADGHLRTDTGPRTLQFRRECDLCRGETG